MLGKFTLRLLQLLFFCHQYNLSLANPLYGLEIRSANENEFPSIVSIGYKNKTQSLFNHFCTGSLISTKHVLTSAHCLIKEKATDLIVKVGSVDVRKGKVYNVKRKRSYSVWARKHNAVSFADNDIAILELVRDVAEKYGKPAPFVKDANDRDFYNKTAVTAGWGLTNGNERPRFLQTSEVTVITPGTCANNIFRVTKEKIRNKLHGLLCTEAIPYAVLGLGDSGGPLMIDGVIIGVNESSYPNKENSYVDRQNFHTSVSYYQQFIEDILNNQ